MRLSKLLLQAFGPFTDTMLDFDVGPANLHLIYGPNEAGKSSALRAMTDLRFGIPNRSLDDFIHPFNQMRIGGVFRDGQGESIGLFRRKGRGATLTRFVLATGQPDPGLAITQELELALTGGLERGEFESMFGLNHERLREGGNLLLKGEGELGSALFEASAGTLGIAAILAGLDADAKKLYNPHGAAKNAAINDARRQLDEHRQALRQAQTKPNDWQTLHRVHEAAKSALSELDRSLDMQRRRDNELTELRTVEPLLRDYERVLAEMTSYADIPDLPENADKQRLSAEQELHRIRLDIQDASHEMGQCGEKLAALTIEPVLLEHGNAIERLSVGHEAAAHSRMEINQQQAVIEKMRADVDTAAVRIGFAAGELRHALPSAGERASLDFHLQEVGKLGERLDGQRQQAEKVGQVLRQNSEEGIVLADRSTSQALSLALRQALALGDVGRQKAELNRQLRSLKSQLTQCLSDLNLSSAESLKNIKPLLENEIAGNRQKLVETDKEIHTLRDEEGRLRRDVEEQHSRRRQFQAEGEVVTAETLRFAREQRNFYWHRVRQAYVEKQAVTELDASLADAFESTQSEADRQADILRADAKRAAGFEECSARIEHMEKRQQEISNGLLNLASRAEAIHSDWSQCISQAGLPALQADSLREWQVLRLNALDLHDRLVGLQADIDLIETESHSVTYTLAAALRTVGCQPTGAEGSLGLPALIEQAAIWEKSAAEAQAKHEERIKSILAQQKELAGIEKRIVETEASLIYHQDSLREWHSRLRLKSNSPPVAIKARLEELDAMERQLEELKNSILRQAQHQAAIVDRENQVKQLAVLLAEPCPEMVEDFIDRLRKRLNVSKEQEQQRKTLLRDQARAAEKLKLAQIGMGIQTELLARLCQAANVEATGQLPEREQAAAQKRQAQERLLRLRKQLAQSSARDEQSLRQSLAGLDAVAIDSERERCKTEIARLEQEQALARQNEELARRALEAIDTSDGAAKAREAMESASARWRAALRPWARLRLAHALLAEALNRFRERAQAPMVDSASAYFSLMTDGRYEKLVAEDQDGKPVLRAIRTDDTRIGFEAMSEGTADQLYLALRLAALELRRTSQAQMPLVLDDVLVTSDDQRATNILRALAHFAEGGQVMLFTHHRHLIELARGVLDSQSLTLHYL